MTALGQLLPSTRSPSGGLRTEVRLPGLRTFQQTPVVATAWRVMVEAYQPAWAHGRLWPTAPVANGPLQETNPERVPQPGRW